MRSYYLHFWFTEGIKVYGYRIQKIVTQMENIKTTTNSQNLNLSEQFKDDV